MKQQLQLKTDFLSDFIQDSQKPAMEEALQLAQKQLHEKTGPGSDFLGWVSLPKEYNQEEFSRIKQVAQEIRDTCDILIVIGIGGSYLGPRAAIDFLKGCFYNDLAKTKIYFAGQHISGEYLKHLLTLCEGKEVAVNVISKSGTTTEPSIAFRFFKKLLEKMYGKEKAKQRIFATTDQSRGMLKDLATREGYQTFVIPDNVGGRFSVLTPVGLLPIAVAGGDVDQLMAGAAKAMEDFSENTPENSCYTYGVLRNILYQKGFSMELFVAYDPDLKEFSEWLKQLFGESEGKEGKGLFPASVLNSTDLHSLGQFVQEGSKIMFETVLNVMEVADDLTVDTEPEDFDGLNFLGGKTMAEINEKAMLGTTLSHLEGQVPNLHINIGKKDGFTLGYLIYFFEKACAISGYILGVNPFDQPGVEGYKKNMFALLEKPGFQEETEKLAKKLKDLTK